MRFLKNMRIKGELKERKILKMSNTCIVCGCETPNKLTCSLHTRLNSQWKSCNNWRRKRGLIELSWPEYQEQRRHGREISPKPRLFFAEDLVGPDVVWDGTDRSPCQKCSHFAKDKFRYGCIKCPERSKFDEFISQGVFWVRSNYSNMVLGAVELSR
jgi:hypothetical protein